MILKILRSYISLILVIFLISCDEKKPVEKKQKEEIVVKKPSKKKKEKVVEKRWDSLNYQNVNAFLTEFGKQNKENKVIIKTKFGDIKIRLYDDVPLHRANFIFLTKINYFNTTVFYRVAKDFVIQGGNSDHNYTLKQRRKCGNYLIEPEFKSHRKHKYGALAAAREWENNPNKLSSPFEFFIVNNRRGAHHLNGEHTVFGEVISGFDTMDKISKVAVDIKDWPITDIHMTVEILD